MFILTKDGKKLINYNNVASIYVHKEYKQYTHPDKWWEIRVIYPAVSTDVLYDTLGKYFTEQECENAFEKLCDHIVNNKEHEVIDMGNLWD